MTDSTDNALEPCPFCEGEAHIYETSQDSDTQVQAQCKGCGAEIAFWLPWTAGAGQKAAAWADVISRWNTRADLAPDPLGAVKVRALEWTQYCSNAGNSSAPAFGGEYICERAGDDGNYGLWLPWDGPADDPRGYYEELAAAKAAAQADYEQRIRSALEPDPLADARVKALVEALIAMLYHSGVADAGPDMKDPEDHAAERQARAALAAFDKGGKDE